MEELTSVIPHRCFQTWRGQGFVVLESPWLQNVMGLSGYARGRTCGQVEWGFASSVGLHGKNLDKDLWI